MAFLFSSELERKQTAPHVPIHPVLLEDTSLFKLQSATRDNKQNLRISMNCRVKKKTVFASNSVLSMLE